MRSVFTGCCHGDDGMWQGRTAPLGVTDSDQWRDADADDAVTTPLSCREAEHRFCH